METIKAHPLNLARKWRSQNFDQIIGQDLVVRMLKNSLYLSYYFPVYLFMGQRGSGKTSMARIFAAAANCQEKEAFQKDPKKSVIPCLVCDSCKAIKNGSHPDFIEIDAASHTGVDNVRQIIESSSFMPVRGEKKIYLIDEAHMLSKGAFNALLKILEEPPASVMFMLATTDAQKIIDTVKSRSFQLFFKPIAPAILMAHLAYICDQEKIMYEQEGLLLIAKESGGSVRDAQNIIEQVRFAGASITKKAVVQVLGYLDDEQIIALIDTALYASGPALLNLIALLRLENYTALYIWRRLQELLRSIMWQKYTGNSPFFYASDLFNQLAQRCTMPQLWYALNLLYAHEALFLKTAAQHALLEMILLQLSEHDSNKKIPPVIAQKKTIDESQSLEIPAINEAVAHLPVSSGSDNIALHDWDKFLLSITYMHDQLVFSLFKQADSILSEDGSQIRASFPQEMSFFADQLENAKPAWLPQLRAIYGEHIQLQPLFNKENKTNGTPKNVKSGAVSLSIKEGQSPSENKPLPVHTGNTAAYKPRHTVNAKVNTPAVKGNKIDVSDREKWPQTHLVLSYFPGIVSQIEDQDAASNPYD